MIINDNKFINIYAGFLKRSIRIERPLKVVFDCSNGVTGLILKSLLKPKTQNLKPAFLNENPDGNFPAHGPDPLKKSAIGNLRSAVLKHNADLGIIFDADGDRVFFIDNKGRFVDPDVIARLLIWHLSPKKVVIDIRTGWLVRRGIMNNELGITEGRKIQKPIIHNSRFMILESKVGHFFIKKLMRKIGADFGAERSGHYYFKVGNFSIFNLSAYGGSTAGRQSLIFYYDSGILAAIGVINAVSKLPYSLTDFVDLSPQYFRSGEINVKIQNSKIPKAPRYFFGKGGRYEADKNQKSLVLYIRPRPFVRNQKPNLKFKNLFKKIEAYYKLQTKNYKLKTTNHLDGLTMEFNPLSLKVCNGKYFKGKLPSKGGGWWFNIRSSNTEPLLRLNMEAASPEILRKEKNKLTKIIKSVIN